jgi:ubiquinone/menaquinone biosynthesis C-methylase UbiE
MDIRDLKENTRQIMDKDWRQYDVHAPMNRLQRFLCELALEEAAKLIGGNLTGKTILIVCAGDGFDADYWHRLGALVTATDLSGEACKKIKERNPAIVTKVEDAEHLSFANESFDYVIVRAGLHHLPRPLVGLYEMLRVAKEGILVMEAQDSLLLRLIVRMGLALEIEPSGNYVYRFTRREMRKICRAHFLPPPRIKTFWYQYIPVLNRRLYARLNGPVWFYLYVGLLHTLNFFLGRSGNNFLCFIPKKSVPQTGRP